MVDLFILIIFYIIYGDLESLEREKVRIFVRLRRKLVIFVFIGVFIGLLNNYNGKYSLLIELIGVNHVFMYI